MEMEAAASTPDVAKKIWHVVRALVFMLREGISKSRIMVDLNLMLKRGNKLAGKAIANLLFHKYHHHHHYPGHGISAFSCGSNDAVISPRAREYEFSCSNSPSVPVLLKSFYPFYKRKHHLFGHFDEKYSDATTVVAVQKMMLEMLNNHDLHQLQVEAAASPLSTLLPGFGKTSPMVRQLRITDSPFPLKDDEGDDHKVDKAAEEFINKFYKNLKLQKATAALESPYHDMWDRS